MSPVSEAVLDGLNKGIGAELAAYVFYKKCLNLTSDDRLKDILAHLAGEEKSHYHILERQYDNLVRSEKWVQYNDVMRQGELPNLDEKMEEVHEDFIEEIDSSTPPLRVLEIALALEKRAVDLYSKQKEKVDDPTGKEMYNYLMKFEKTHVDKIQNLMKDFQ